MDILTSLEEEGKEEHEQEHAAEGSDGVVSGFQNVPVGSGRMRVAAFHCKVPSFNRTYVACQADDQEGEDKTHTKNSDQNTDCQEDIAPCMRHFV